MAVHDFGTNGPSTLGTAIEVDFGATPIAVQTFTITDGTVTATSKVLVTRNHAAATGKSEDENEFDHFHISVKPGTGSFALRLESVGGAVAGKYKFFYVVLS